MKGPKLLYVVWALALAAVTMITLNGKRESTDFQGIAETREVIVNSENAVEIKAFHVGPGQDVKKGKLLVELNQPELTKKITELTHQLAELKAQRKADAGDAASRIKQLGAEKKAVASEIDYKIRQLESRKDLNKKLASGLKSIGDVGSDRAASIKSPIDLQIESLKKERELTLNRIKLQIDAIRGGQDPLAVRAESLEKELTLLNQEKRGLLVFARIDGVIGSVHFKRGEKVSPFVPILTLYTKSPSYVKGFIHEKIYNRVAIGDDVQIVSLTGKNGMNTGEVVGVGSRIVEYPVRLRKRADIQVWGREVQIRLPSENDFLLGEKVMIRSPGNGETYWVSAKKILERLKSHLTGETAYASGISEEKSDGEKSVGGGPVAIRVSGPTSGKKEIEASGLAYLADLKKFLVISDDTKGDAPILWLMGGDGTVEKPVSINGLDRIDDMEAICAGDKNDIFIACSQSPKKSGNVPADRQLLVRAERNGSELTLKNTVRLRKLLKTAAKKNRSSEWVKWLAPKGEFDMDVEGMFFHSGDLHVGFKKPLRNNRAVVLKIKNIGNVMSMNRLAGKDVEIWKTFDLKDPAGNPAGISDLHLADGRLRILSYAKIASENGKSSKSGSLWEFDMEKNRLGFVRHFPNRQPEGVAYNPDEQSLVIVFDGGGNEPSEMLTMGGEWSDGKTE